MKSIIRSLLFHAGILWVTPMIFVGGFIISHEPVIIASAAFFLTALHMFVKPILHLLLLPISITTFGLASWLAHVVILYLLLVLVPQIQINPWHFAGLSYQGFSIPAIDLSFFWMLVVVSMFMAVVKSALEFLMD